MLFFSLFLLFSFYNPPEALEYTLHNGMHLIMIEDHSFPLVNVTIVVGAGSSKEKEYNSGLSHLLEHMLFDGTEKRSREELRDGFERRGIYANAFTREDFVAYLITAPSEHLREGLELQADMLLHSIIPESELEKEKKVVIEELKKDADDPENVASELFDRFALSGTPYSTPVIGYSDVIRNVTREELYNFYKTYYVPNNMTALVVGDFTSEEVVDLFEEFYGSTPPAKIEKKEKKYSFIPKNRLFRKSFNTKNVHMRVGLPAPPLKSEDVYAFDVLVELLNGESGILMKKLGSSKNPLVTEASAAHIKHHDLNYLLLSFTLQDTSKIDDVVEKLKEIFKELRKRGIDGKDVEAAKRRLLVEEAYLRENYTYFTMNLTYWIPLGGYEAYRNYINGIKDVSASDVARVLRNYFESFNYTALALIPQSIEKKEKKKTGLTFKIERKTLSNGLLVIAKEVKGSPIVSVHILVKNPLVLEPADKNGVAHFLQRLLGKATRKSGKESLENRLALLGARLKTADNPYMPFDDYYKSRGYSYIRFQVLKNNMEKGLDLLKEIIYEPSFEDELVEETRGYVLSLIKRESTLSSTVAKEALFSKLFRGTFLEKPLMGHEEDVRDISGEDLKVFWRKAYSPNNLIVSIVGDMEPDELIEEVEKRFAEMSPSSVEGSSLHYTEDYERGDTLIYLDREFAYIYGGRPIPPITHPDSPAIRVATLILSKRLQNVLREKKGLAYRLGSGVRYWDGLGMIAIGMGTRSVNINEALKGIREELKRLRDEPPGQDEIDFVVNDYWGRHLRFHQRSINQAYYLGYYEYLEVGYEYDLKQVELLRNLRVEDLREVIEKYFRPQDFVFAVAGKLKY